MRLLDKMRRKKYVSEIDVDFLDKLRTLSEEMGKEDFIAMVKRCVEKGREEIIPEAIKRGLFTEEEYNAEFKDKYNDPYGCDSFSQYIGTVLHVMDTGDKDAIFVTLNDNMLKNRDMLKNRFGVRILHMEELGGPKNMMSVIKEIEVEKEIVRRSCIGLVHPDPSNQQEFTRWLQDIVIFHLNNLEKRLMQGNE